VLHAPVPATPDSIRGGRAGVPTPATGAHDDHPDYRAEESNKLKGKLKVERQLVGLPWAADGCPWVGKLRTMFPFYH
jgi:hypothetical protein